MRIFCALDWILFGVFKKRVRHKYVFDNVFGVIGFVLKAYHNVLGMMIRPNCLGAFNVVGLQFDHRSCCLGLIILYSSSYYHMYEPEKVEVWVVFEGGFGSYEDIR
jgi:hypothetical protein